MSSYLICDEVFEKHDTGRRHPEKPERLASIRKGFQSLENPPWEWIDPDRKATQDEIEYFHAPDYIQRVKEAAGQERALDADTPVSRESYEIARLAAGSALLLTDTGLEELSGGFGAVRPPGHHAESRRGMGFCLFNNIVLAANHATRQDKTVAIVDVDVHHGNGTQNAFYDRSDVLYVSTHQSPFYPGTGHPDETGNGEGEGYTLNVTLTARSDWSDYEPEWRDKILPRLQTFEPDFLMVSAGFDAHRTDPIGGLNLTDDDFLNIASDLNEFAQTHCENRLVGLLEGGYNLDTLNRLVPRFTATLLE